MIAVPAVWVSSPDTVPLALLLKVAELLTVPVTAPPLAKVLALVTFDMIEPVEANVERAAVDRGRAGIGVNPAESVCVPAVSVSPPPAPS